MTFSFIVSPFLQYAVLLQVRIFCPCGRKSEDVICLMGGDKMDVAQAYQRYTYPWCLPITHS